MKIMHMADLHIGKSVNGFSLLEDQAHICAQILDYIAKHKPAAIIIAGDVYDKPAPAVEAVRLFDRLLSGLAASGAVVMLISGNHDSSERLGFAGEILQNSNVYINRTFTGRPETVVLHDEYGQVRFHLLSFLRPAVARRVMEDAQIETSHDAVRAAVEAAGIDKRVRNVLATHQFVTAAGCEPVRSESEIGPVGGVDNIDVGIFDGFDYVALGHLHGAQGVRHAHVRYAGSPLKYSFSECHHKKSMTLVELGEKGDVRIEALPLAPLRDMRRIRGPLAALLHEGIAAEGNPEDYLHVTLTDEEEVLDAMGRLRSVYPNVMALAFDNRRARAAGIAILDITTEQLSPYAHFERFFFAQNGMELQPKEAAIARELLEGEAP